MGVATASRTARLPGNRGAVVAEPQGKEGDAALTVVGQQRQRLISILLILQVPLGGDRRIDDEAGEPSHRPVLPPPGLGERLALAAYQSIFRPEKDRLLTMYEAEDQYFVRLLGTRYAGIFRSASPPHHRSSDVRPRNPRLSFAPFLQLLRLRYSLSLAADGANREARMGVNNPCTTIVTNTTPATMLISTARAGKSVG
ncbi:MAG: hypothetical protein M1298_00035, partial [Chloroflexi bacterium]|nr:hypothetical protein [Chloroflexota bacterium]